MTIAEHDEQYRYDSGGETWNQSYLWPKIQRIALSNTPPPARIIELGCGNGFNAKILHQLGYSVVAIDSSETGIQAARDSDSNIVFDQASVYGPLCSVYGRFHLAVSIEVIEHLLYPARFVRSVWDLLEDGGLGILTTPYHGYWKNLALAVLGRMDTHFTALWEGGHVKFFSKKTMTELLASKGFEDIRFEMAGRLPFIWKSMIVSFRKPVSR